MVGWPVYPDNYYQDPLPWCAQFLFILLKLYPTGRVPTKDALPTPGGLIPVTPPTVPVEELKTLGDMIGNVSASVSSVRSDVGQISDSVSSLTDQVSGLAGQMTMLTTAVVVEAIVIVILAVGLIMGRRKQS